MVAPLLQDFRALRARLQQQGLFCSNKAYYAFKLATNLSILAGAMLPLALGANSWWLLFISAFLLGLFWQQTGQRQTPAVTFWLLVSSYLLTRNMPASGPLLHPDSSLLRRSAESPQQCTVSEQVPDCV